MFSRAMDEVDTENMNPEEIYNSFRKTSADIQSLNKLSNQFDEIRKERERYMPLHGYFVDQQLCEEHSMSVNNIP